MMQYLISMQLTAGDFLFGLLCLIIIGVIIFFNTAKGKGVLGEWRVRIKLRRILGKKAVFLNDCIFIKENYQNNSDPSVQKTVQIDHIVVGEFGVLVVETKNLSGEIYGKVADENWTQVLKYGRKKYKVNNPIKQNWGHYYCVRGIVGSDVPIYPIVVFVKNNADNIHSDHSGKVLNLNMLKRYLRTLPSSYTMDEVREIADRLQSADQSATISNRKHTKNIERIRENVEIGICPRCGRPLVRREGKFGRFWGCSNYPKCTFTKKDA